MNKNPPKKYLKKGILILFLQWAGNPPALSCASSEDTATCLAMILSVYLTNPTAAARKSLSSRSLRR
jgi:hypothetical protein